MRSTLERRADGKTRLGRQMRLRRWEGHGRRVSMGRGVEGAEMERDLELCAHAGRVTAAGYAGRGTGIKCFPPPLGRQGGGGGGGVGGWGGGWGVQLGLRAALTGAANVRRASGGESKGEGMMLGDERGSELSAAQTRAWRWSEEVGARNCVAASGVGGGGGLKLR